MNKSSRRNSNNNYEDHVFPSFKQKKATQYKPLPEDPRERIKPIPSKYLENPPKEYLTIKSLVNRNDAITDEEFERIMANLFPNSNKAYVGVAVSGGVDSMALAHLAHNWCKKKDRTLYAFVVDHGVRKESKQESKLVKSRLENMGIETEILVINWKDDSKTPTRPETVLQSEREAEMKSLKQEDFRNKRYEVLKRACRGKHVSHLLLGQHFDDCIETLFMRIALGSGINGYSTIESWRQIDPNYALVRPLLRFNKAQMEATCKDNGIEWVNDPSNQSDIHYRNRVRKLVNAEGFWNTIPKEDFAFFINQMNQTKHEINILVNELVNRSVTQDMWFGHLTMNNLSVFVSFNPPFAVRILSYLIKQITGENTNSPAKIQDAFDTISLYMRIRKSQKLPNKLTVSHTMLFWSKAEDKMIMIPTNDRRDQSPIPLLNSPLRWKNFIITKNDPSFKGECFVRQAKDDDFAKIYKVYPHLRNNYQKIEREVRNSVPVVIDKQGELLAVPHFKYLVGLKCSVQFRPILGDVHKDLDLIFQGPK